MARAMRGKNFSKIMVSRVYFGNWLRDYSQAIDVGTVKSVSAEAIRLLLCILGFLTFGYGSDEFEITADRLGCYRPEDHIDNPKNYADNQDARQYDPRLRGPVDEKVELSVDPETGMKNYIANERADIMTSARHVRDLFGRCIELGRRFKVDGRKEDLHEALRLMGTGLHCLEGSSLIVPNFSFSILFLLLLFPLRLLPSPPQTPRFLLTPAPTTTILEANLSRPRPRLLRPQQLYRARSD